MGKIIMTNNRFDIVIIGAGIGGLICGTMLAKNGKKVLIIEKNKVVGGCCCGFTRKNVYFDAGAHIFGSCDSGQALGRILSELNIDIKFNRISPAETLHFPDKEIVIPADLDSYAEFLSKEFTGESSGINKFFELLKDKYNFPVKFGKATYQELLDNYFEDAELKAILSGYSGFIGLPPKKASALVMIMMMASYLRDGVYYPAGGAQNFSDSIKRAFLSYGGVIALDSKLTKITISEDRISSVLINDSVSYIGDEYIFNIDPIQIVACIGKGDVVKKINSQINKYMKSVSAFIAYMTIEAKEENIKKITGWHFNSYDLNTDFLSAVYITSPFLYNKNFERFKNIPATLEFFQCVESEACYTKDYIERKDIFKNKMIARFGNKTGKVLSCEIATPLTIERYTGNSAGAIYGWENTPDSTYGMRLKENMDFLQNMYMTGHWTYYGSGIISAALSGMDISQKILMNKYKYSGV